MSGSGRESITGVWQCSKGIPRFLGVVGMPSRMTGSGQLAFRRSISGREALMDFREWSGVPSGCTEVVGRPFGMSRIGRETLPDFLEWWEALPDVGSGRETPSDVQEALMDARECSGVLPGFLGVVGRPSQISGNGRETLPNVRE